MRPGNGLPPVILSCITRGASGDFDEDIRATIPLTRVRRYLRKSVMSTPENWTMAFSYPRNFATLSLERFPFFFTSPQTHGSPATIHGFGLGGVRGPMITIGTGEVSTTAGHDMQGDAVAIPVMVWECAEFPPPYNFGGEIFGKCSAPSRILSARTYF